jgi:hypothetical protein
MAMMAAMVVVVAEDSAVDDFRAGRRLAKGEGITAGAIDASSA